MTKQFNGDSSALDPLLITSTWCSSKQKRIFDFVTAFALLTILSPMMLALAVVVAVTSPGPILFRQRRPGRNGIEFYIVKFRTMVADAEKSGPAWTRAYDPRITVLGRFMRKWKLDELPQLINVLRGEMSLVGPRPLPSQHWQHFSGAQLTSMLAVRPGITSAATLHFRNEEELLGQVSLQQTREFYARIIIPMKLKLECDYFSKATLLSDVALIFKTAFRVAYLRDEDDLLIKNLLLDASRDHHGETVMQRNEGQRRALQEGQPISVSGAIPLSDATLANS